VSEDRIDNRLVGLQNDIQSGIDQLDGGQGVEGGPVFENIRELSQKCRNIIDKDIQAGLNDVAAGRFEEISSDNIKRFLSNLD